jgi:hypothetical protein
MAPERKHHSDTKDRKASRDREVATINDPANSPNAIPTTISSFVEHRLSTNINTPESAPHTSTSNGQVQIHEQEGYLCIDRPWEEKTNGANHLAASSGMLPIDRWQSESMLDGPWHGMAGVYALQNQNFLLENDSTWMDGDGKGDWEGKSEEARSMACGAPSSKK